MILFRMVVLWAAMVCLALPAGAGELDDIKAAIKGRGASWTAGETSVMKESKEERQRRASLISPLVTAEQEDGAAAWAGTAKTLSAPAEFDWRDYGGNFVTPVRDQGSTCGSCWAFGATAALEAAHLRADATPGVDLDLAEQILISCGGKSVGTCSGGYVDGTSDFFLSTGIPPESYYPYAGSNSPCSHAAANWTSFVRTITGWTYITTTAPTVEGIKAALLAYGPLVTSMKVYSDFYAYTSGTYSYTSGTYVGLHAPLIIGYNDKGGYFAAKNSWGTGWGESGFFRIAYSELSSVAAFGNYTIAYNTGKMDLLTVNKAGEGAKGGKVTTSGTAWRGAGGATRYPEGTAVTVTAQGSANSVFDGWTGCDTVSGAVCEVLMAGDRVVTASFRLPGKVSATPGTLNFRAAKKGEEARRVLTIKNAGAGDLSVEGVAITGTDASEFFSTNPCTLIPAAGTCAVDTGLTARSYGKKSALMHIFSDDPKQPAGLVITLTGNAVPPKISVSPKAVNFGTAPTGGEAITRTVTIKNTGLSDLIVASQTIGGAHASDFTLSGSCSIIPAARTGGSPCVLRIGFTPREQGARAARMEILSNDPSKLTVPVVVNLTGRGK